MSATASGLTICVGDIFQTIDTALTVTGIFLWDITTSVEWQVILEKGGESKSQKAGYQGEKIRAGIFALAQLGCVESRLRMTRSGYPPF